MTFLGVGMDIFWNLIMCGNDDDDDDDEDGDDEGNDDNIDND